MSIKISIPNTKSKTALQRLHDLIEHCHSLGCKEINPIALKHLIFDLIDLEKNLLKDAFIEGRDFESEDSNKLIYYAASAEDFINKNYF